MKRGVLDQSADEPFGKSARLAADPVASAGTHINLFPEAAAASCTHLRVDPDEPTPVRVSFADSALPTPAKSYHFNLDPFQREAIVCLERKENVLVAAHTSAGFFFFSSSSKVLKKTSLDIVQQAKLRLPSTQLHKPCATDSVSCTHRPSKR